MSFFPLTVSIVTTRGIWHYNIISNLLYPGHDTMILLFFSLTPCNHRRNGSLKGSYYTIFHLFFSPWGPLTLLITFFHQNSHYLDFMTTFHSISVELNWPFLAAVCLRLIVFHIQNVKHYDEFTKESKAQMCLSKKKKSLFQHCLIHQKKMLLFWTLYSYFDV